MIDDTLLFSCNETELLWMARRQGMGFLRRGIQKDRLVALVSGREIPKPDDLSPTGYTRGKLEKYLQANIAAVSNMLPGCDGMCTKYPCSEGRHAMCFVPSRGVVQ